ncbi:hypothetical protein [Ferruginibacter sp. SUN106]|uniref:hypothetical protein n=1 Tax=Ferruginibacter sp. SUN106 TaxID=2978348 RepID=UPI003D36D265
MKILQNLIYLFPLFLFFYVYFFQSQKIYFHNRFIQTFLIFFSITLLIGFVSKKEDYNKVMLCGSILFFYILLLWVIKKKYQVLNQFFIKKQWITEEFQNKDFTWMTISHFNYEVIWEKKIATKPSLLDRILSLILIFMPMLLALGLSSLTRFLF